MADRTDKILLIGFDDEERHSLYENIVKLNCEVQTGDNGDEGYKVIEEWRPDLVILDLYLPDMTGIELTKKIKDEKANEDLPVFLISSETSEEASIICLSSGASEYIVKPVRTGELVAKIKYNLELAHYKCELKELNVQLEKEKSLLLKYFSSDLVEKILSGELAPELGGSNLTATILFFDIRGSTGIAEKLAPEDFASFISFIFTDVMDLLFINNGSVNKLLGDGILATFGCPFPSDDDAENCVKSALRIREYLKELNTGKNMIISGQVDVGMGISTGVVFAGNIGSVNRMEYTVMGDPVDMASRLQNLTRDVNCDIIMDKATRDLLGNKVEVEKPGDSHVKDIDTDYYIFKDLHEKSAG